jgi:hypothetical protein
MMRDPHDYLWLEEAIIQRVRALMPELKLVAGAGSLAQIKDSAQIAPAVHVLYAGDVIGSSDKPRPGNGRVGLVTQSWAVVLVTGFGDRKGTGTGAREKAGPLIGKLLGALSGFMPEGAHVPFVRQAGRVQPSYEQNFFYMPLVFETSFFFQGGKQ